MPALSGERLGLLLWRRGQALAGLDQIRLVASALLGFWLIDFVRLTLQQPPAETLISAMDGLTLIALLVLLWRPRTGILLAAIPLVAAVFWSSTGMEVLLLVALGCAGALLRRGETLALSGALVSFVVIRVLTSQGPTRWSLLAGLAAGLSIGLVIGWSLLWLRRRRERQDHLTGLAALESARLRADERAAISRELHDVVVHQLSTVSLQAMAAEDCQDPQRLREIVADIGDCAQEALRDLRLLTSVLRDAAFEAAPGVEIQELTQRVPPTQQAATMALALVEAGFEPDVLVPARADDLPMTVQQTISRVIAEGVDNVIHHAPARCRCVVRVLLSEVCATVHVLSPVPSGFTMPSLGWGLRGLQERIHLTGGCFEATVTDEQWSLRAVLPLE